MSHAANSFTSWRGLHHLALVTPDIDAPIYFYQDVLGMQLGSRGEANMIHGRTAAFLPGANIPDIHFFELATAQIFTPDPNAENIPWIPGALHHIAFGLPDEAAALALRERLQTHGASVLTEIMDQGDTYNFIFADNNGMMLEANWPKE